MRKKAGKKGFTVIELLIVMAIMAILYTIAAFYITGLQNEARTAKANGDLKVLQLALNTYQKNKGECPAEENYQATLILSSPRILEGNLKDPYGETPSTLYRYDVSDNGRFYVAYSVGPNRNGFASVGDEGNVLIEGAAIISTNGYID